MTTRNIKVAIGSDFLSSFSRIPKNQQNKVLEFVNKFRSHPDMSSINYEKIHYAKDQNLRSVRIDQDYRGIVLKPEVGNVYLLLWVDHHDEAYRWAKNKVCEIHPETGGLQVYSVQETELRPKEDTQYEEKEKLLFSEIKERHLLRLGVPEIHIPLVRRIASEDDLEEASKFLPSEAYEALYLLAAGYSLQEVLLEMERTEEPSPVDSTDFERALENPDSKRRFFIIEDDLELAAMLSAPLEKWRVFLHPSQRKLVEKNLNGPCRVLGGAGTGKTVVAMHRAKWLAENVFMGKNDRILFTTYTRNLAEDIKENLKKICSDDALKRIEVLNLDRWVSDFLRSKGYGFEVDYGYRTSDLWDKALSLKSDEDNLPESFYKEEWEAVIQPQGINSLEQYIKARRIGRGVRLSRTQRRMVWTVFEEYRILLNESGLKEREDAFRDARHLLESNGNTLSYKAIIVDEAQDMGMQAFKLIRQMIPEEQGNDLFIVGDSHQRIYRQKVVLGHCGINIRGRSKTLKINYRTTEETRKWAVGILEGINFDDLDGGLDEQRGYKSLMHGPKPEIYSFNDFAGEVGFICEYLKKLQQENEELKRTCVVVRTNSLVEQYRSALNNKGIPTYSIKRSEAEDRRSEGVRIATMHRVKGLEFDRVIVVNANDGIIPLDYYNPSSDPVLRKESEIQERSLLYVSLTRAKKEAVITCYGKKSKFLTD